MAGETHYTDMFGIEYTKAEYDTMSTVWVCTEHKRFLPCRTCNSEPWRTTYPHSCDEQDIQIVRQHQSGLT